VTINAGVLDLNDISATIGGLSGVGIVTNTGFNASALTVNNAADCTYAGTIQGGDYGGTVSLTKTGAGQLTLTGANAMPGVTTVNAGTLVLNNASGNYTAVNVNGGSLNVKAADVTTLTSNGGAVLSDAGVRLTTAVVNAGVVNTQGNNLTIGQSLTINRADASSLVLQTSGATFGVKAADLRSNLDQITVSGDTLTLTPTAVPAGVRCFKITDDTDCQINSGMTYTHAIDPGTAGGGPVTINGVAFARGFAASGLNAGSTNIPSGHNGNGNTGATAGSQIGHLLTDMVYNNANGQIILKDLTPGNWYDLRLYQRQWEASFDRTLRFDYKLDGAVQYTTTLNEDDASQSPPSPLGDWASNTAYAMGYVYQADANGQIEVDITQTGGGTYHLYGLTNQAVSIDPTINLPTTDVAVTATSALNLNYAGTAVLGNLKLSTGTLSFQTATKVNVNSVTATGNAEIAAGVPLAIRGGSVAVNPGATLSIDGSLVDAAGPTALTKTGAGTLLLTGANTYTGGTTVSDGVLEIGNVNALPAGGSLTIDGTGSVVLSSGLGVSSGSGSHPTGLSPAPVPEPGTWALLIGGVIAGLLAWRRKKM
jgi:autotransporter-associated beta strand protein